MSNERNIMDWMTGRSPFFTFGEFVEAGLSRKTLFRLVRDKRIEHVCHGIFAEPSALDGSLAPHVLVSMRYPGVVLAGAAAAHIHFDGLTSDNLSRGIEVIVERDRKVRISDIQGTPVRSWPTIDSRNLVVGVEEMEIYGRMVRITTPERTAIDLIRKGHNAIAVEVLGRLADDPSKHPASILKLAHKLGQKEKVQGLVEGIFARRNQFAA